MKTAALIVSGLIFLLMCVLHIIRYINGWTIVVAGNTIPLDASIFGAIVTGILAIWMFIASTR